MIPISEENHIENNQKERLGDQIQTWAMSSLDTITRVAIIFGLIALIAAEVVLLSKGEINFGVAIACLPFGILGLLLLIGHFEYASVAILFSAAFIPFNLPTGRGSPIVASLLLSMGLVGLWVLRMMLIEKKITLKSSPVNLPTIGFVAITMVSLAWSNIFRDPSVSVPNIFIFVQLGAAGVMVMSPVVSLLVGNTITNGRQLKIIAVIMMLIGLIGLVENFLNINLYTVIVGLTSLWVVALAVSFTFFDQTMSKLIKIGLMVMAGLWVLWNLVLNLNWYAGWLPGIVALGVIAFFRSKRLLIVFTVLVLAYIAINYTVIAQNISFKQVNDGNTRMDAWLVNWNVTSQHLFFGTGPAGYAAYYMALDPNRAMATHNNYIDIISETGVTGLVLYLWLFGAFVWQGYRVVKRLKGRKDFYEALGISAFAGLIGCIVIMAFGDWLIPFAYTQTIAGYNYTVYSWIFMGTILALDNLIKENGILDKKNG
jgi:O-antigen ligase